MAEQIQLTICLSFAYKNDRELVKEHESQKRKLKQAGIIQTFINMMLMANYKEFPVIGQIDFAGKNYTVEITADEII